MCSRITLLQRALFFASLVLAFITCSVVCITGCGYAMRCVAGPDVEVVDDSVWAIDDVIMQERAQDFRFSPDGLWVL